MSHEQGNNWDNPNTEMIQGIKLPEFGNLSLEEVRVHFGELEAAMRQGAQQRIADQRENRVAGLAQYLAAQQGRGDNQPVGRVYDADMQQSRVSANPVEHYGDDELFYTQGMPIVFASESDRLAYERTKKVGRSAPAAPMARRHEIGPNGEITPINLSEPTAEPVAAVAPLERKKPRVTKRTALLGAASIAALAAGGVVVWQTGAFGLRGDASANVAAPETIDTVSTLPLSQVETKLLESYGACFDESGRGVPVVRADVSAVVPVTWPYTDPKGVSLSLGAIVNQQQVKPVVKLVPMEGADSGATVGLSACVVEADREVAIVSDDATHTVTIDLAKISPQLQEGVYGSLAGFLRKDEDAAVIKADAVIDQMLTNKVIADTEAIRLKAAYADEPNKKAERDQAVRKTSEAIVKDGDVYANRLKAALGPRAVALVQAQLDSLRKQGIIDNTPVEVKTINAPKGITIKGAAPAKADAFSLTDPVRIVTFNVEAENK